MLRPNDQFSSGGIDRRPELSSVSKRRKKVEGRVELSRCLPVNVPPPPPPLLLPLAPARTS